MIRCSVCSHENDDLAVVCVSCKSFLQSKVNTLDLFQTVWMLMLSPQRAFRRIVISRHKNYVVLLTSLLGISVVFSILWLKDLGRLFSSLFTLLFVGLLAGPPVGVALALAFTVLVIRIGRILGGKASFRGMYAVVAYSSVPIILTLVLVFPIEIAIFGLYLFDNNPPPLVMNPGVYLALLGMDALGIVWAWLLLVDGFVIANGFTRARSLFLALGVFLAAAAAVFGIRCL